MQHCPQRKIRWWKSGTSSVRWLIIGCTNCNLVRADTKWELKKNQRPVLHKGRWFLIFFIGEQESSRVSREADKKRKSLLRSISDLILIPFRVPLSSLRHDFCVTTRYTLERITNAGILKRGTYTREEKKRIEKKNYDFNENKLFHGDGNKETDEIQSISWLYA